MTMTMDQEMYSLTSQTYPDNLRSMMKELLRDDEFSDVTLVTDDKKHLKGHMNILCAASPVFRDILQKEKKTHPIIFLRGTHSSDVESILEYIYLGEATFYQERMVDFLAVAKSLEIEELCIEENEEVKEESVQDDVVDDIPLELCIEENEQTTHDPMTSKYNLKEKPIKSNKEYLQKLEQRKRKVSFGENVKYPCNQCDFQTQRKSNLTRHIQNKHEDVNVKYNCDQCDYQASLKQHLTRHIQNKHNGVKYLCDHCDYQAGCVDNLKVHIHRKHEDVKYDCDQCDYQCNHQNDLRYHIQNKHKGVIMVRNLMHKVN